MPTELLHFHAAAMAYGDRLLWQAVDFVLHEGEFAVLLGANGSGKTTLFRVLLGLACLQQGSVTRAKGLRLGYVAQLNHFDPRLPLRGRDLVRLGLDGTSYCFGLWPPRLRRAEREARIAQALIEVGAETFADAPLDVLSGGERQRLRIAQALVSEPQLLLLDEPLVSLDPGSQQAICAILDHRKRCHRTAVFMITHDLAPVLPLADTVLTLHDGHIHRGEAEEHLATTPETLYPLHPHCVRHQPGKAS